MKRKGCSAPLGHGGCSERLDTRMFWFLTVVFLRGNLQVMSCPVDYISTHVALILVTTVASLLLAYYWMGSLSFKKSDWLSHDKKLLSRLTVTVSRWVGHWVSHCLSQSLHWLSHSTETDSVSDWVSVVRVQISIVSTVEYDYDRRISDSRWFSFLSYSYISDSFF